MTRKITLCIILILLIFSCFELSFGSNETIRAKVASIHQLSEASKKLNEAAASLELKTNSTFDKKKEQLSKEIENYDLAKTEYDELVPTTVADDVVGMAEADLKDIYDVDFLWTIIGNYATEEGVLIDMNVVRNTTSASSIQNSASSNFIVCDLKFVATGKYMNLASFIQSMEDDDRLSFEINNFNMQKSGENLQVTLTVKEIKINADNFIESGMTSGMSSTNYTDTTTTNDPFNVTSDGKAINSMVQTIDSTTTGATNTTYNAN